MVGAAAATVKEEAWVRAAASETEVAEEAEAEMEAAMEEETSPATSPHRYPSLPGCSC
jgi:hypothetical protein